MKPKSIRIKAVEGILAPRPRHGGRPDAYFGRGVDHTAIDLDHDAAFPPLPAGEEVRSVPLDIFQHVARYVKDGSLLPADAATAKYCGVSFAEPPKD